MSYNKENYNVHNMSNIAAQNRNLDPKNTAVITMSDFERIKDTCALVNRGDQWKQVTNLNHCLGNFSAH
jgi:hypothetical protein